MLCLERAWPKDGQSWGSLRGRCGQRAGTSQGRVLRRSVPIITATDWTPDKPRPCLAAELPCTSHPEARGRRLEWRETGDLSSSSLRGRQETLRCASRRAPLLLSPLPEVKRGRSGHPGVWLSAQHTSPCVSGKTCGSGFVRGGHGRDSRDCLRFILESQRSKSELRALSRMSRPDSSPAGHLKPSVGSRERSVFPD